MKRFKTILVVALIVLAVISHFRFKFARHKLNRLQEQSSTEQSSEQSSIDFLDSNLKSQIVVENEKVVCRTKDKSKKLSSSKLSSDGVSVTTRYLPPEGNAKIDVDLKGNTTVSVKNKGLTFEPEILAFMTTDSVKLGVGARVAYWNRYGVSVGLNTDFRDFKNLKCFVGLDRRLIDVLPMLKNTTVGVFYDGDFGIYFSLFF